MGDRTWTHIRFSGIITREVAEGLIAELEGQGCCSDTSDTSELIVGDLVMGFYDDDCNYATMNGVEAYCREHHISYKKSWAAGGGYGPGMEIYNAVVDTAFECADIDGDPVVSLPELIKVYEAGKIEDTINYLRGFVDFQKNYPPLEIVDAQV